LRTNEAKSKLTKNCLRFSPAKPIKPSNFGFQFLEIVFQIFYAKKQFSLSRLAANGLALGDVAVNVTEFAR
jgi:hypothetical protein